MNNPSQEKAIREAAERLRARLPKCRECGTPMLPGGTQPICDDEQMVEATTDLYKRTPHSAIYRCRDCGNTERITCDHRSFDGYYVLQTENLKGCIGCGTSRPLRWWRRLAGTESEEYLKGQE